jgi:hypothetical protein
MFYRQLPCLRVAILRKPRRCRFRDILRRKKANEKQQKRREVNFIPTSKKQMVKLNQAKKAKAEELSKQAAAGSLEAKKKLKKLEKKLK